MKEKEKKETVKPVQKQEIYCPDCGAKLIPAEGCLYCPFCGWSKCKKKKNKKERKYMKNSETVEIYTDGACSGNPGPGGWAAVLLYKGIKKRNIRI